MFGEGFFVVQHEGAGTTETCFIDFVEIKTCAMIWVIIQERGAGGSAREQAVLLTLYDPLVEMAMKEEGWPWEAGSELVCIVEPIAQCFDGRGWVEGWVMEECDHETISNLFVVQSSLERAELFCAEVTVGAKRWARNGRREADERNLVAEANKGEGAGRVVGGDGWQIGG